MSFIRSYRWLIPSILFCLILLVVRMIYTQSFTFIFLIWNLFLAVLPLYFAYRVEGEGSKRKVWLYAVLWLLFFPNAMYITTDLFHLHERVECPLWFDLLLLLSFAINGLMFGFMSLSKIEKLMNGYMKKQYILPVVFIFLCLSGYGIYLGRYLRWNSWDIVTAPFSLMADVGNHVIHPFRNREVWLLSLLFGSWMFVLYRYIKRLSDS